MQLKTVIESRDLEIEEYRGKGWPATRVQSRGGGLDALHSNNQQACNCNVLIIQGLQPSRVIHNLNHVTPAVILLQLMSTSV